MLELFNHPPITKNGDIILPSIDYSRLGIQTQVERYQEYSRTNSIKLPSNYLLIRLLKALPNINEVDHDLQLAQDKIKQDHLKYCRMFNLYSSFYKGEMQDKFGLFLGKWDEYILASEEWFDVIHVILNWKTISAVTYLRHPSHLIDYRLAPDVLRNGTDNLAIVKINLPMLALQYWCWQKSNQNERIEDYVYRYILMNMLPSYTDHAYVNRIIRVWQGEACDRPSLPDRISLIDYTDKLDETLTVLVVKLKDKHWEMNQLLSVFPAIYADELRLLAKTPEVWVSRHVKGLLVSAKIKFLLFLIKLDLQFDSTLNRNSRQIVIREKLRWSNDHNLLQQLPPPVEHEWSELCRITVD